MVRSIAIPLLLLAAISLIPTEVGAASITYNVVDYPALQNGATVSGTITTNGTIGTTLPGTDITSWSITITGGFLSVPLTFDTSNTILAGTLSGGTVVFDATPTALTIATPGDALGFATPNPMPLASGINWQNIPTGPGTGIGMYGAAASHALWQNTFPTTSPVAIVPEPSSAVLGVIGAVSVVACGLVRRRRAQRRQAAA